MPLHHIHIANNISITLTNQSNISSYFINFELSASQIFRRFPNLSDFNTQKSALINTDQNRFRTSNNDLVNDLKNNPDFLEV